MAIQALMDHPSKEKRFVLRKNIEGIEKLKDEIDKAVELPEFTILSHMTDGQASTCIEGSNGLDEINR